MTAPTSTGCQQGVDGPRWWRIGCDAEARVMPDDTPVRLDRVDNGLTLARYRGHLVDGRSVVAGMIEEGVRVEVWR